MQSYQSKDSNLYSVLELDTQLVVPQTVAVVEHNEQNDHGQHF